MSGHQCYMKMRTTLSLDPDVARQLKARVAGGKASFEEVVNDTLRRGLAANSKSKARAIVRVVPRSLGFKAGIDVSKLNQLADDLEVQEFAVKMRRGRKPR